MEEIQVGEFVRFEDGKIERVTYQLKEFIDEHMSISDSNRVEFLGKVKHSFNLIDLIEEGDYVNGYKVDFVQNNEVVYNHNHPYKLNMFAKDIKTIVTHEQFSSLEYKVEEK